MAIKLPGGFSPLRAVQQVGSYVNPTGGVTDYDVFSDKTNKGTDNTSWSNMSQQYGSGDTRSAIPTGQTGIGGGGWGASPGVTQAATTTAPYGGGGGGSRSAGPSYNPGDLAYLNAQESQLRQLLQSAQGTLGQGLSNLSDSYNREQSSANQQRGRALENFGIQREDTTRAKQDALGKVDTNARTLSDGLRRILGMASGTGSSAYQFAAPNAVARLASQNRTGVLGDYGANERDLGLAENRAKTDFEQLLEDLARQRGQKESELRGGVAEREQAIQRDLGNVAGERAKLMGGGYDQVRLAQQPFMDAISNRQSEIDSLFDRFRSPQLDVNPVNVQTPQLRDYMVDRAAINANNQEPSRYSPYSQFLNPGREEEQQIG